MTIKDVHVDPSIAGTVVDNTNCTGVMQNGTITISIDGGAVPTNYTIAWFEGNGTTTPLGTATTGTTTANNTVAQNLPAGIYTVQVTDNTTPGNSCLSTATFTVTDDPAVIAIAQDRRSR